ncbi:MAG: hypothetical protein PGN07_05580 [Aeromicrobium erythreum]
MNDGPSTLEVVALVGFVVLAVAVRAGLARLPRQDGARSLPRWAGPAIFVVAAAATVAVLQLR